MWSNPEAGMNNDGYKQGAFSEFMSVHYTNESDYSGIGSNDLVANDENKIQKIGKEFQQEDGKRKR